MRKLFTQLQKLTHKLYNIEHFIQKRNKLAGELHYFIEPLESILNKLLI